MWVDDNGVVHTVWVPPEAVLGTAAVSALQAVPDDVAGVTLATLDRHYEAVVTEAERAAPHGPVELHPDDLNVLPYPPLFEGLDPRPGDVLEETVLSFLADVPAVWRIEVLEAISELLDRHPAT